MRNLESLINDMRSTRDISRVNANNSTTVVGEIAKTYTDIITNWLFRLEEANTLLNMQMAVAPKKATAGLLMKQYCSRDAQVSIELEKLKQEAINNSLSKEEEFNLEEANKLHKINAAYMEEFKEKE